MLILPETALEYVRADGDDVAGIATLLRAAESACVAVLNRNVYPDVVPVDDITGIVLSPDIEAAIMLVFGQLWVYRDGTGSADLPGAALALLRAHRWMPAP